MTNIKIMIENKIEYARRIMSKDKAKEEESIKIF